MTYWGWDYAWWRPSNAQLKSNGVDFVCRYISYDNTGKNITKAEYNNLLRQGVAVVLNWEYATDAAKNGWNQGVKDAREAERQRKALGAPAAAPIYFSCDWDATPGQQGAINNYLAGCASIIGRNRVGVYGSYYVVKRSMEAGKAKWGWCTYAWSGGNVYSKAHIYQYQNGVMGGQADRNKSLQDNFGQIKPNGTVANTEGMLDWMSNASELAAALKNDAVRKALCDAVWNKDGVVASPYGDKSNPEWMASSILNEMYLNVNDAVDAAKASSGVAVTVDQAVVKAAVEEALKAVGPMVQAAVKSAVEGVTLGMKEAA